MSLNTRSEITYQQNRIGRTGHALKDIFTAAILSELFDLTLVADPSWTNPLIRYPPQQPVARQPIALRLARWAWEGVTKEEFFELAATIQKYRSPDIRFVLTGVYRIHLSQVHQWENDGDLPQGSLATCLARLNSLYWGTKTKSSTRANQIAIHIRRGDVADPAHHEYSTMGPGLWSADYYRNLIENLRASYPDHETTLYSEDYGSQDLLDLPNVVLELGGAQQFADHFGKMVTASIFIPTSSSMSTWAAYLSQGQVLVPSYPIKHFDHPHLLSNWSHIE